MQINEIINGVIEAFTNAVQAKNSWAVKAVIALLRDIEDSFPIGNYALSTALEVALAEKTSWGKNQLVLVLHAVIIDKLCGELVKAWNDEPAPPVEAAPAPVPEAEVPNAPVHSGYKTSGAMIVAAAKTGWLRDGKVKAKACSACRTNNSVFAFNKGDQAVTKCYVCGISK